MKSKTTEILIGTFAACFVFYGLHVMHESRPAIKVNYHGLENEIEIINAAFARNGIEIGSENYCIGLAIRKAEDGRPGLEFGIMNPEANDLDSQAGWCAASIVKSRARWGAADRPEDFITFMGRRYCPPDAHPLNKHWVTNVTYWASKYRKENYE
jgi:hypothetical protein